MKLRALQALELPKALSCLAGFAVSEAGYQACLDIRPCTDLEEVRRKAALFEQGRLWALRTDVRLSPFPAVDGLLQFLASPSALLELEELFALRRVLSQGRDMMQAMLLDSASGEPSGWPLWAERCRALVFPEKSVAALGRCLSDEGVIRDGASPELSLVRGELRRLHQQCVRKVKDYAAEYNIMHFLQDSFMTLSSDRYVLPLKANFKGRLQGVIHDYSQTGETCYFEPLFLVEINNRLQELKREEREEERKVLLCLTELAREELPGLRSVYVFLLELDVLFAKTALAACYDGRMVDFVPDRGVLLHDARHPLLALGASPAAQQAWRQHALRRLEAAGQGGEAQGLAEEGTAPAEADALFRTPAKVVASTLELLPGQQALVISGGNAGGKTVCLKALGLIALMSLCALPVPVAAGSVLPLWRRIHAFIGDEQSLEDHVSTFTAQITHLGRIWPELGPDSLVILDEFGAGTDPSQGAALAQAVVDSLMEVGAFVVAATHFPALKAYALSTENVRAASVLFDPKTKKPLFRLVYDQVGASQALDVAREHGLPEAVLRRAEQYLLVSGEDSSALVERLNALAVAKESELAQLAGEKAAFSEKRRALQDRFERERSRLFDSVQAEAGKVLADWKTSKLSHRQALTELSRIRGELAGLGEDKAAAREAIDLASLTPRQRLRHVPWKRVGLLLEVDERKKRVRLDVDGVSLWTDASDVRLLDQDGQSKDGAGHNKAVVSAGNVGLSAPSLPLRLDLRGFRADVAISDLEKFLDSAILIGRDVIEVIHGRGTGVLRREVHGFLKHSPAVRDYRLAPEDQGGDGMTIVELK